MGCSALWRCVLNQEDAKNCRGPLSSLLGWSLAMSLCELPLVRGDYETVRRIELPNSISVVSFYLFCASMYFLCLCSTYVVTFPAGVIR